MLVADGADPVTATLHVFAAVLADPHAAGAAGGAPVDDAPQLRAAAGARAAGLQADTQRALAAEVLKLRFQPAGNRWQNVRVASTEWLLRRIAVQGSDISQTLYDPTSYAYQRYRPKTIQNVFSVLKLSK